MRLATLRRSRSEPLLPGLHGPARVERRAPALARRARPGDIAVLEHLDLDGSSARLLLDAGVAAVVNAAPCISGRYPNLGPQLLVQAGIPVLDQVGPEVIRVLDDGDKLRLDGDALYRGDELVCRGTLLTAESVAHRHGRRPDRPRFPAAGVRPRHHRAPAPGARPAARRHRRPGRRHPASRAARWSSSPAARAPSATCATCAVAADHRPGARRGRRGRRRAARRRAASAPGRRRPTADE